MVVFIWFYNERQSGIDRKIFFALFGKYHLFGRYCLLAAARTSPLGRNACCGWNKAM
jgi:hypothetical protein